MSDKPTPDHILDRAYTAHCWDGSTAVEEAKFNGLEEVVRAILAVLSEEDLARILRRVQR